MLGKKIWWIAGLVVVVGLGAAYLRKQKENKNAVIVKEEIVVRGSIQVSVLTTGTVQPENRLEIKSPVAGRVDRVLVEEGQLVKKGQVLAWMSSAERAALIDSARASGPEEVKKWEDLYKPTPVVAPIAGMIILKSVEDGQTFTTNDAVLVMSNRLTVKAQVDETDLAQIRVGQESEILLDSYPEQKITGRVDSIAFEAKTISNVTTYTVIVAPSETPGYMRSGMTANVRFFVEEKKDIVIVSTDFIKYDKGKPMVLVKSDSQPIEREVELGVSDGKRSEIVSGLAEGETIVLLRSATGRSTTSPFSPFGNRGTRSGTSGKSGSGEGRGGATRGGGAH